MQPRDSFPQSKNRSGHLWRHRLLRSMHTSSDLSSKNAAGISASSASPAGCNSAKPSARAALSSLSRCDRSLSPAVVVQSPAVEGDHHATKPPTLRTATGDRDGKRPVWPCSHHATGDGGRRNPTNHPNLDHHTTGDGGSSAAADGSGCNPTTHANLAHRATRNGGTSAITDGGGTHLHARHATGDSKTTALPPST